MQLDYVGEDGTFQGLCLRSVTEVPITTLFEPQRSV